MTTLADAPALAARSPLADISDEALLARLSTDGDRMPREVVDEIVRRGARMVAPLAAICADEDAWYEEDGDASWKPIHATFILGAIGGERAVDGLLEALDWATALEVDWVTEVMASMLGAIGAPAIERLLAAARDGHRERSLRSAAVEALGAIARRLPAERARLLDEVRRVVEAAPAQLGPDDSFADDLRSNASAVLLDFAREGDRTFLLDEAARQEETHYIANFGVHDVESAYKRGVITDDAGARDWLDFYAAGAIEQRQRRWKEEAERDRWRVGVERKEAWVAEEHGALLARYASTLGDLDEEARVGARRIAELMASDAMLRGRRAPWAWETWDAESFLTEYVRRESEVSPRKLATVPGDAARFVRFCASDGKIPDATAQAVEKRIESERASFLRRALDPTCWDLAKSSTLRMRAEGIDTSDKAAVAAWVERERRALSLRLGGGMTYTRAPDALPDPIRTERKVGRNEPCPCRSGKKFKKCCGAAG